MHAGLEKPAPSVPFPPDADAPLFTLKQVNDAVAQAMAASKRRGPVAQEATISEGSTVLAEATARIANASRLHEGLENPPAKDEFLTASDRAAAESLPIRSRSPKCGKE